MTLLLNSNHVSSDEDFMFACKDPNASIFIEKLWSRYEKFADKDFAQKVATRFNDHFWEMYLACTLQDTGKELLPKAQRKGPDIEITSADFSKIWVEAVTASAGYGEDKVPLSEHDSEMFFLVPEERIVLRCANAIDSKFKKYIQYRNDSTIGESEPYVIAVNGNKVPYVTDDEIPYVVQALLPFGLPTVQINRDVPEESTHGYEYRPQIKKVKGCDVPTNIFLRKEYEGISGVIFSSVGIRDFQSKLGSDFIFLHNPLALNKLPDGWLKIGYEYRLRDKFLEVRRWPK